MKKTKRDILKKIIAQAVKLSNEGLTLREIEKMLPRSRTTLAKYIKEDGQNLDKK